MRIIALVVVSSLLGACAPAENNANPFQEADIQTVLPPGTQIMTIGGGWGGGGGGFVSATPELDVSAVVPGRPTTFKVEGLSPGQSVALYGGTHSSRTCGTRPIAAHQPFIGTACIGVANAVLIGGGVVDWAGNLWLDIDVPATMALNVPLEFEAVVIAMGGTNPHSDQVPRTTTDSWLTCQAEMVTGDRILIYGEEGAFVGRRSCTAHGGDMTLQDFFYTAEGSWGEMFDSLELYADGQQIGHTEAISPEGVVEFNDSYPLGEDETVFLDLVANVARPDFVPNYTYAAFVPTRVGATDADNNNAPWIGQEAAEWFEIAGSESLNCEPWLTSPEDYTVDFGTEDAPLGVWHCSTQYGGARTSRTVFDLVGIGGDEMYQTYTVTVGDQSFTALAENGRVTFNGYADIFADEDVEITLKGNRVSDFAQCGSEVTPTLVSVEAVDRASGENILWTGAIPGATTVLSCAP